MEKISGFRITGMRLSGFKSYAQSTDLTFYDLTSITGGNGRGKSSIADAIAFAVTGLPFFGERGNDRLVSEQTGDLSIAMRFVDDDGTEHELKRSWNKSQTAITYDGKPIRQSNLTEMFGEKDVFLSIFNPLYFIEELGEKGKDLLERHLPMIAKEDVMAQLSDAVRERLKDKELLSPDVYLKRLREQSEEAKKALIYLQGQLDLAQTQALENTAKKNALQARLSELTNEQAALKEKRFDGIDVPALQSHMADLSAQYSDLMGSESGADAHLLELTRKLGERRASVYVPKYTEHIATAKEKVKALGARYHEQVSVFSSIAGKRVCPTCRRSVTEADLPKLKETYQQTVGAILTEGKAEQAKLDELYELEQKARDTFAQFKAEDIAALEAEIETINAEKANDSGADDKERLRNAIQELTTRLEYGNLSGEEYERLQACTEDIRQIEAELSALQNAGAPSPDALQAKIDKTNENLEQYKEQMKDAALFIAKKTELLAAKLKLNRVEISLYDVVKSTGEVKDVFKFNYNGRRYDRLSLSEKIRAGMELSELMKRLTGRNYPVFVDNMESVDDLANVRPTGQVLMARCVKNAELRLTPIGQAKAVDLPKAA
ncbi:MAG: AAA family ATPase [Oscillospiraceae bacterium]|nr:AAA family ATPase [Oscillospiraceae bacterium]